MTRSGHPDRSGHNGTGSIAALEADIARQRRELADTVEQLHARLDVRARAQDKVQEVRDRLATDTGQPTPALLGALAGVAAVVVALVVWRRGR